MRLKVENERFLQRVQGICKSGEDTLRLNMWRMILKSDQCKVKEEQSAEVPHAAQTMWRGLEIMELVDQEEMRTMQMQWAARREEFVVKIVDRQLMETGWMMLTQDLHTPLTHGCTYTHLAKQAVQAILDKG